MGGKDGTALQSDRGDGGQQRSTPAGPTGGDDGAARRSLQMRIASALVLAPLALVLVWGGSPWLELMTTVAAGIMAWEWSRLCRSGRFGVSGIAVVAIAVASVLIAAFDGITAALTVAICGPVLVYVISRLRHDVAPRWTAFGTMWVALPCVAFVWLARDPKDGIATAFWLLAVVWATDIGAFFVGRMIGGPKLAPRVSPKKTWSGLIGGIVAAMLAGCATGILIGVPSLWPLAAISGFLAIVDQVGDLAESRAKRRFGVKDASDLIPGHGGLLDRLDGMLAVAPAVALLTLLGGASILTWQL